MTPALAEELRSLRLFLSSSRFLLSATARSLFFLSSLRSTLFDRLLEEVRICEVLAVLLIISALLDFSLLFKSFNLDIKEVVAACFCCISLIVFSEMARLNALLCGCGRASIWIGPLFDLL